MRLVGDKLQGSEARLGIRPQHLKLDPKGKLPGKVTLVERLGTETVVELISPSGTPFRYATPETLSLKVGEAATYSFKASDAHFF